MSGALLDLKTTTERPKIAIDGELYEILSPDELGIADRGVFAATVRRIAEIMAKESLDDDAKAEAARLLREVADRIMVGVPEAVRAKLNDTQRLQVAEAFTILRPREDRDASKVAARLLDRVTKDTAGGTPRGTINGEAVLACTGSGGAPTRPPSNPPNQGSGGKK